MTTPATFAASAIAELAFQAGLKSGAGELSKRFTQEAIKKMGQLRDLIWNKLKGNPDASEAIQNVKDGSEEYLKHVVTFIDIAMDKDEEFASQIQILAKEINAGKTNIDGNNMTQNISDNAMGWQNKVDGGVVYQAESITTNNNNNY